MTRCSVIFLSTLFWLITVTSLLFAQQYSNPYGQQGGYQSPYGQQESYPEDYPYSDGQGTYQDPYAQQGGYQNPYYGQQGGYDSGSPYDNYGQQSAPGSQGGYYPPPQGSYGMQQGIPGQGQWQAPPMQGGTVSDALGHFSFTPPQGLTAYSAIYNFVAPASNTQVSIMSVADSQMLQSNMQSFSTMVQNMGGRVQSQQNQNFGGRQAMVITATTSAQQSGMQTISINAFIQSVGIWVQVTAPIQAQNQAQMVFQQVMQNIK